MSDGEVADVLADEGRFLIVQIGGKTVSRFSREDEWRRRAW
jgi:hypothetical protein